MKASVNREKLIDLLCKVSKAAARKSTLPVLQNVLLLAIAGRLTLAATDLTAYLAGDMPAKIAKQGGICFPAKPLLTFLKAVADTNVTLSLIGKSKLQVTAGRASATIEGMARKDFPDIPASFRGKEIKIKGIKASIAEVGYAMATEEYRPVLHSIGIGVYPSRAEMCAADGFRMAVTKLGTKGKVPTVNIPAETVALISKLMPGDVTLVSRIRKVDGVDGGCPEVQFKGSGLVLISRCVQGNYPGYDQLIPKGGDIVRFDRDKMLGALKLMGAVANCFTSVRLLTRGKKLRVYTKDDDGNKVEATLDSTGKARAGYNPKYLKDAISRLPAGEVKMRTAPGFSPAVFKTNGTTHVIMPMAVKEFMDEKTAIPPATS